MRLFVHILHICLGYQNLHTYKKFTYYTVANLTNWCLLDIQCKPIPSDNKKCTS